MQAVMFILGDYVGGGIVGALTAAAVHVLLPPEVDLALAMLLGMAVGMLVHIVAGLVLSPLLGFFHVMVPAGFIGMYGGMFFAMRDVMERVSLGYAIRAGAIFGLMVMAGVHLYDRALVGPVSLRGGK